MISIPNLEKYWTERHKHYLGLQWANDATLKAAFVGFCLEQLADVGAVLDLGCGHGEIGNLFQALGYTTHGIDICPQPGCRLAALRADIEDNAPSVLPLDAQYDLITARMVFHHLLAKPHAEIIASYLPFLKTGGHFAICEGVPPAGCEEWYAKMFALKEERLTLTLSDLITSLTDAGLNNIASKTFTLPDVSIGNWLRNSALDQATQDKIYAMHRDAPPLVKHAYRMREVKPPRSVNGIESDILCTFTYTLVRGEKTGG